MTVITVQALYPALACLLGLIVYLAAKPDQPRLARLGELTFFAGLLVTLFTLAAHTIKLGT